MVHLAENRCKVKELGNCSALTPTKLPNSVLFIEYLRNFAVRFTK
ncbi:hypothetical protein NSP_53180 [Nodularia spumigena CCY9414]|nr:hypothetical protein NSP_53180 [Nodularia spumigena CCY9414]